MVLERKSRIFDLLGSPLKIRRLISICLNAGWGKARNPAVSFGLNPTYKFFIIKKYILRQYLPGGPYVYGFLEKKPKFSSQNPE
jgi:hypothetical protein